jgi:methionine sulfoxide reductase catalytic subunit
MTLIRIPPSWEIAAREITPEAVFLNRRRFLKNSLGAGLGLMAGAIAGCDNVSGNPPPPGSYTQYLKPIRYPEFAKVDRPITDEYLSSRFNNFYEFGTGKGVWKAAQDLPLDNWQLEVTGLVDRPQTYGLEDLQRKFPLEERVYRFRCVEAWAMVVPWLGFPMKLLVKDVEPKSNAKFVRFTSYFNEKIRLGPKWLPFSPVPWPYTEGMRLDEMTNDLAFFATGIYGHALPKQHGAPIRAVIPWKYGFKGAKSLVKIEFLAEQPSTFWNTIAPQEYGFEANVNPNVPHPRWSQATEKIMGKGASITWEKRPTLLYNGYGEYVASLYNL